MDKAVSHQYNNPVFYQRDLVFTKLVVDKYARVASLSEFINHLHRPCISRIKIDILTQEYNVFYIGTTDGRIYKIVQYIKNNESKSKLLDVLEIAQNEVID